MVPARSLKQSVIIVQPVAGAQNDFRPHIDARLRYLYLFDIRLTLIHPATANSHVMAERPQIIRFVDLTEDAITCLALAAAPHSPR